jgi:phosphatidylglycerol:prolipoprotein diacylglycerol transferase
MITIPIDPIIVSFGHLALRWYSLIIMAAIAVGFWIALREADRKGFRRDTIYDMAIWLIPSALLGARLFHVIDHWKDTFAANPGRILNIWEGGLAIWGAVVGGLIALAILAWRNKWKLSFLLDLFAPALVLGMAVGRLACIITGDSVGKVTEGPLGLAYISPNAMVPQLGVYYTPTPVYEFVMNLTIFTILWRLRKRNLPDGALFFIFLSLYSVGRFIIAIWSSYLTFAFGLNQAQLLSLISLAVSIPILIRMANQQKNEARPVVTTHK